MPKTLQSIIRQQRKAMKLTQSDVADSLKMRRSTYADKEARGDFDSSELKKLSKIIGIPSERLSSLEVDEGALIKNPQEWIVQAVIRIESINRVILKLMAERIAIDQNRTITEVLLELEQRVNSESLKTFER